MIQHPTQPHPRRHEPNGEEAKPEDWSREDHSSEPYDDARGEAVHQLRLSDFVVRVPNGFGAFGHFGFVSRRCEDGDPEEQPGCDDG